MPAPSMPAASGGISIAETKMATMLSKCASFQTFAEAGDATAALARISFDSLAPPAGDEYTKTEWETIRPYSLIWKAPDVGGYVRKKVAELLHTWNGVLYIHIERDIPSTYIGYVSQGMRAFKNLIGGIIAELCDQSGIDVNLDIMQIDVIGPIATTDDEIPTYGQAEAAILRIEYQ